MENARDALKSILVNPDHSGFQRALYIIRFSARHQDLRRRFIAHDDVIQALVVALENVPKSCSKDSFPLVTESLCHLLDSGAYDQRRPVYTLILKQVNDEITLPISSQRC